MLPSLKSKEWVVRSRLKLLIAEKEARDNRVIRQNEITEATGLNAHTVSRWMSPEPFERIDAETVKRLCSYLSCDLGDLLHIDRNPN